MSVLILAMNLGQTTVASSSEKGTRSRRSRIKIVVVVAVFEIFVIAGLAVALGHVVLAPPQTVSVSGSVTSNSSQFFPNSLTFIDGLTTAHYYTLVLPGLIERSPNGSYSIILPNMREYFVVLEVENSSGFVGNSCGTTLQLHSAQPAPFILNIQC